MRLLNFGRTYWPHLYTFRFRCRRQRLDVQSGTILHMGKLIFLFPPKVNHKAVKKKIFFATKIPIRPACPWKYCSVVVRASKNYMHRWNTSCKKCNAHKYNKPTPAKISVKVSLWHSSRVNVHKYACASRWESESLPETRSSKSKFDLWMPS